MGGPGSFFDWCRRDPANRKAPWLIVGKGPTFAQWVDSYSGRYRVLALNDAMSRIPCHIGHVIDLEALDRVGLQGCAPHLVIPWRPHVNSKPGPKTLKELCKSHPILRELSSCDRVISYNSSTTRSAELGPGPVIRVRYFSAVAAVNLLASAGVKQIRTLGVDGGKSYAPGFSLESLLANGRQSFDCQFKEIQRSAKKYGIDIKQLED